MTFSARPRLSHLCLLAFPLLCLLTQPRAAQALNTSHDIYILKLWPKAESGPENDTLSLQLAWREGVTKVTARAELRDPAGVVVAWTTIVSPDGLQGQVPSFEADLEGAFGHVENYGWSYWVGIREEGSAKELTDPFPVHLVGCEGSWELIPGLATDAVVVSRALSTALDLNPGSLASLSAIHPELACEIGTFGKQFDLLEPLREPGQPLCQWQVSVLGKALESSQRDFELGGAYYKGIESGATHCYSSREDASVHARAMAKPAMAICDPQGLASAASKLRIKTRCRETDGQFLGTVCGGGLEYATEIKAIAKAHLHQTYDASSRVCGDEQVELEVEGAPVGSVLARAMHFGEIENPDGVEVESEGSFTHLSAPPSVIEIRSTGGAYAEPGAGGQSFAEYGNWFSLDATGSSTCTVTEEALIHFEAAPFLAARQNFAVALVGRNQSGNIKEPDW